MHCGEKERERGGGGRGRPDPLIARHSCPFVRHLIASRGSHGILRGGYLRPPSDLFDRVRVSGTRGSSRRYLPDTFSPPSSFLSHPSEPTIRRTDFLSLQESRSSLQPGSVWSCANYRVTRKPIAHFPRKRRVIRAQGWGTRTPTRFLESNDSGLSRSTNNRGHRDTNRCEIINRTDSRHFPVLYARGMKILGTSINRRTRTVDAARRNLHLTGYRVARDICRRLARNRATTDASGRGHGTHK